MVWWDVVQAEAEKQVELQYYGTVQTNTDTRL